MGFICDSSQVVALAADQNVLQLNLENYCYSGINAPVGISLGGVWQKLDSCPVDAGFVLQLCRDECAVQQAWSSAGLTLTQQLCDVAGHGIGRRADNSHSRPSNAVCWFIFAALNLLSVVLSRYTLYRGDKAIWAASSFWLLIGVTLCLASLWPPRSSNRLIAFSIG